MNTEGLILRIKEHQPEMIGLADAHISAVCIPLLKAENGEWQVLFEVRSSELDEQPGDICLPGGALEGEELPMQAAVREVSEELMLPQENIELLGEGDSLFLGNILIHTFPALLHDYHGTFNRENAEVFAVPLAFFAETMPDGYVVERTAKPGKDFPYERIYGGQNYQWRRQRTIEYFYQWKDKTIWGITARIMRNFAETILL